MSKNVDDVCGGPGESNVASKGVNGGRNAYRRLGRTSRVGGKKRRMLQKAIPLSSPEVTSANRWVAFLPNHVPYICIHSQMFIIHAYVLIVFMKMSSCYMYYSGTYFQKQFY